MTDPGPGPGQLTGAGQKCRHFNGGGTITRSAFFEKADLVRFFAFAKNHKSGHFGHFCVKMAQKCSRAQTLKSVFTVLYL